jgi:two-component system, OmpR family, osmolarity sensor histidine kinase EnvZ
MQRSPLHPFRALKRIMPRRLFGRSLIIIVTPMIFLQAVVTTVFFDRNYRVVTATLTRGVANDVGYMVMLENERPPGPARDTARATAARLFGYTASFTPGAKLAGSVSTPKTMLDRQLIYILSTQIAEPATFDTVGYPDYVDLRVQLRDGVLGLFVPRARVAAANAPAFVVWMIGSSLVLIAVAVLFLRNQVRPIERLAIAAEAFGKGRSVPGFKPEGATEVRRAAIAFLQMRERIDRHVNQRTDMLAGISHDLKTPLTRIKLALAMMAKDAEHDAIAADVTEMERMLNEYLEFARGEGGEQTQATDLSQLARETAERSARTYGAADRVTVATDDAPAVTVRPNAIRRCLINLLENALKYGTRVALSVKRVGNRVEIAVDDDGPGIPELRREEAFRPFHRLDEGRNLQRGGVGLGLAIARDIARAHGGEVVLEQSRMGGLRAVIRLPI